MDYKHKLSDFTKIKKIGKGGFGTAYLARRNSDELEVCLKEIPLNKGLSEQAIEGEAKMLSELNNNHIIRSYGSFIESGTFYIVMEYSAEGSLAEMIIVCHCGILFMWYWIYILEAKRIRPRI